MAVEGAVPADCFGLPRDAERAFELLRTRSGRRELSLILRKPLGDLDWKLFNRQLEMTGRDGYGIITCLDASYPPYFRDIGQSPAVLFYRGDRSALDRRGVALVGNRKASARGIGFARSLAGDLAAVGITVVSGAALGIDTAAHRGALDGGGVTVAVLGTGLDVSYPPGNAKLLDEIAAAGGCALSEQLFGTPPLKYVFPQRNRLISGLSFAVVVVEAPERSGALITARWALEQGREVGAVPGFPGDPRSRGTNQLIKSGAFPVEGAEDVLEAVPALRPPEGGQLPPAPAGATRAASGLSVDARAVYEAVGSSPVDVDTLARHLDLAAGVILAHLLELELRGLVERDAAGAYHTR